jgi:hypothetical protein
MSCDALSIGCTLTPVSPHGLLTDYGNLRSVFFSFYFPGVIVILRCESSLSAVIIVLTVERKQPISRSIYNLNAYLTLISLARCLAHYISDNLTSQTTSIL